MRQDKDFGPEGGQMLATARKYQVKLHEKLIELQREFAKLLAKYEKRGVTLKRAKRRIDRLSQALKQNYPTSCVDCMRIGERCRECLAAVGLRR